jgi:hypothetical protein
VHDQKDHSHPPLPVIEQRFNLAGPVLTLQNIDGEMSDEDRRRLQDRLMAANRVLILLGAIDSRERTTLMSPAIRECMQVYADLLKFHATASLSGSESASLQEFWAA